MAGSRPGKLRQLLLRYGFSPTGRAEVDFTRASGSVGYQYVGGALTGSLFAGLEYAKHDFNPGIVDPLNVNDRWGAIFNGRVATTDNSRYPFALDAQYSTANNEYWVRARPGIKFGKVTVGPELGALGNRSYDEVRFGGFTAIDLTKNFILQFHVGYADALRVGTSGGSGAYGGTTLVFLH